MLKGPRSKPSIGKLYEILISLIIVIRLHESNIESRIETISSVDKLVISCDEVSSKSSFIILKHYQPKLYVELVTRF